ncbi:hypothetical protein J2808_000219 [Pseudarthrobacter sulfonivorans]|nr:hypothetical protein [Pseudarthrobacter sulfonivorans]
MTAAMNAYRDDWLRAVIKDKAVSRGAWLVASAIACAMGRGNVAPTDWQSLNVSLRRERTNLAVLDSISELQSAGYLGNGGAHSHGWLLTLPG